MNGDHDAVKGGPPPTERIAPEGHRLLGMVLAAGRGKRMRPLTDVVPKPALPVAGRPLVHLAVENLQSVGVDEAHVNTWHLNKRLREVLETIGGTGFNLLIHDEPELLGTAGGLLNAFGTRPEAAVVVHNGDVLYRGELDVLVEEHIRRRALATLGLVRVGDRGVPRSVILAPGGHIDAFRRERIPPPDAWTFTGIHVISPELFEHLPKRGCIVADVYKRFLDTRRIVGIPLNGVWADLGTVGRYKSLHARVLADSELLRSIRPDLYDIRDHGGVTIHPRAHVEGGIQFHPPVIVDAAAEIQSATVVGPNVFIGAGARVRRRSQVANAVVFPGAVVMGDFGDVFLIDDVAVAAYPPAQ